VYFIVKRQKTVSQEMSWFSVANYVQIIQR